MYSTLCHLLVSNVEGVAIWWQVLIYMVSVRAVVTKRRVRTPVLRNQDLIASTVKPWPLNNLRNYPPLPINWRRRNVTRLTLPLQRTLHLPKSLLVPGHWFECTAGWKEEKVENKKPVKSKPSASPSRPAAVSTDQRFDELDQKWSDRFNWLESLLLARTLDQPQQEPTFGMVKVVPAHSPPASVIRSETFQQTHRPTSFSDCWPTLWIYWPTLCIYHHRPLGLSLTDINYQTDQQLLQAYPMPFNRPERFLPVNRIQTVLYLTDPLLIFSLRRESCRMNWMLQLQTRIILLQKNNLTGKQWGESGLLWAGPTFWIWIQPLALQ